MLWRRASVRNVSISTSIGWPITSTNLVDIAKSLYFIPLPTKYYSIFRNTPLHSSVLGNVALWTILINKALVEIRNWHAQLELTLNNTQQPTIRFTMETENDNAIPFSWHIGHKRFRRTLHYKCLQKTYAHWSVPVLSLTPPSFS